MAGKRGGDERQTDFFGAPAPEPKPSRSPPRPRAAVAATPAPPPPEPGPPEADELEQRLAGMSPAEVRMLVAGLPDAVLAQLTLATIRQLRRRLGRGRPAPVLDRAARELMAELGGQGDEEYDF